jgi:hypothetical protein
VSGWVGAQGIRIPQQSMYCSLMKRHTCLYERTLMHLCIHFLTYSNVCIHAGLVYVECSALTQAGVDDLVTAAGRHLLARQAGAAAGPKPGCVVM